jgi:amino acid transporter
MTHKKDDAEKRRITSKQIVAWVGIVLLLTLYIITLLVAIFDTSSSGKLFALCLFATVAIPLLIWIYTWMYGKLTGRRTIADFDAGVNTSDINKED